MTRQYQAIWGIDFAAYNCTWFNGNETETVFVSPWKENVPLLGTDSFQNPPYLEDN